MCHGVCYLLEVPKHPSGAGRPNRRARGRVMTDQSPPVLADEIVEVSVALDGERVDRALAMITGRSRSEITDLITAERIFVNDVAVHVRHHRVSSGDVIRFDAKPLEER